MWKKAARHEANPDRFPLNLEFVTAFSWLPIKTRASMEHEHAIASKVGNLWEVCNCSPGESA
eukprot:1158574-Pelagomonas_calceolata.AAC.2